MQVVLYNGHKTVEVAVVCT